MFPRIALHLCNDPISNGSQWQSSLLCGPILYLSKNFYLMLIESFFTIERHCELPTKCKFCHFFCLVPQFLPDQINISNWHNCLHWSVFSANAFCTLFILVCSLHICKCQSQANLCSLALAKRWSISLPQPDHIVAGYLWKPNDS